ncbi:hypothetical protein JHW43_009290 [Diplocarpon mali]|nr:hypothetical protein JHW43_009290 [Diplocarpon mali]
MTFHSHEVLTTLFLPSTLAQYLLPDRPVDTGPGIVIASHWRLVQGDGKEEGFSLRSRASKKKSPTTVKPSAKKPAAEEAPRNNTIAKPLASGNIALPDIASSAPKITITRPPFSINPSLPPGTRARMEKAALVGPQVTIPPPPKPTSTKSRPPKCKDDQIKNEEEKDEDEDDSVKPKTPNLKAPNLVAGSSLMSRKTPRREDPTASASSPATPAKKLQKNLSNMADLDVQEFDPLNDKYQASAQNTPRLIVLLFQTPINPSTLQMTIYFDGRLLRTITSFKDAVRRTNHCHNLKVKIHDISLAYKSGPYCDLRLSTVSKPYRKIHNYLSSQARPDFLFTLVLEAFNDWEDNSVYKEFEPSSALEG